MVEAGSPMVDTLRRPKTLLEPNDLFVERHIGPSKKGVARMLEAIGCASLDELIDAVIPSGIRLDRELDLGRPRGEHELLQELRRLSETSVWKLNSASSRPWAISAWYGVYCVYQPGFCMMLRRITSGVTVPWYPMPM